MTNYATRVPTVTNATCSSSSNCAAGSLCTSSSQCTTGNCCAYIVNMGFSYSTFNQTTYPGSLQTNTTSGKSTLNSQAAYNAFVSSAYFSGRYCLSNIQGTSTTSYYDTTTGLGSATASNSTSTAVYYYCNLMASFNQAETIQAAIAAFVTAVSLMYIA